MDFLRRSLKRVATDALLDEASAPGGGGRGGAEPSAQAPKYQRAHFPGDDAVARIESAIQAMGRGPNGVIASVKQAVFQRDCVASLFPLLYGRDWDANAQDIMRRHGRTTVPSYTAFIAARSDGKTVAVSMVLAALLYSCSDMALTIGIFAAFQKQTSMLIENVHRFVLLLPDGAKMCERSQKELRVWPRGASHRETRPSTLMAKSSNADAARGLQPDIIVVDEASFVNDNYWYRVILPMTMADRRVLWAITSPTGQQNLFHAMTTKKLPNGQPLCAVTKPETCGCGPACNHRLLRPLVHKSDPRKADAIKVLYARNAAARAREVMGATDIEATNVFDEAQVDRALRSRDDVTDPVPFIFVGIDPSAGGEGSRTACVIFTFQNDKVVVRTQAETQSVSMGSGCGGGGGGGGRMVGQVVDGAIAACPCERVKLAAIVELHGVEEAHLTHKLERVTIVRRRVLRGRHTEPDLVVQQDREAVSHHAPKCVQAMWPAVGGKVVVDAFRVD